MHPFFLRKEKLHCMHPCHALVSQINVTTFKLSIFKFNNIMRVETDQVADALPNLILICTAGIGIVTFFILLVLI